MLNLTSLRALAALALFVALAPSAASSQEVENLFDGQSLEGWDGDRRFWTVEDGAITGTTTAEKRLPANTFLVWKGAPVADFELRLCFRIEAGNSGIQYRSRVIDAEKWVVGGYQADLCVPTGGAEWIPGICYDEKGRGVLARRGESTSIAADGQRTTQRFGTEAELLEGFRVGEWNDYRIRAVGTQLEHEINGAVVSRVDDHQTGRRAASGVLALQLHTGPPMRVQYKDLRLTRLDAAAADDSRAPMVEAVLSEPEDHSADVLAGGPKPQWIWTHGEPDGSETVELKLEFDGGAAKARLRAACDNKMTLQLNGKTVARSDDWASAVSVDVGEQLVDGRNTLLVRAENEGGPAGFALKLALVAADGSVRHLVSDEAWTGRTAGGDAAWAPVHGFGEMGVAPWGDVFASQPTTSPRTVKLRPGFELEVLYEVPKSERGSWVSITPDGSKPGLNRFFVSDQYGGLFRVTPGESAADTVIEDLDTEVGKAHGMLWAFDSLYVMGAGPEGTGMYRLFDHDGDGAFDEERFLAGFAVGSEHGAHAIHLGPGGEDLYVVGGNMTPLPERVDPASPRKAWANDFLNDNELPPSGHNAGGKPLGGWVLRFDPDAKSFTHICGGYRNAYDMAFDLDGELFVYDSDMEYDGGAPWYRPTRVLHVLSGADFGWRRGAGKWPEYYADSFGSVIDIGQGSPTGVCFGYGAKFPERYQRALYLLDWTYGRVRAVHLQPDGASYTATAEDFIVGKPLPFTDVAIGADGAMYLTLGGRRTQSYFMRLRYVGEESTEPIQPQLADASTRRLRALRRELESMHRPIGPTAVAAAWPSLGAPDRALRHAARVVLEHQPLEDWAAKATAETAPRASIQALVALARVGRPEHLDGVLAALDRLELASLPEALQVDALRAWSLAFVRLGKGSESQRAQVRAKLEARFPSGQGTADREYARVLTHLGSTAMIEPALRIIESSRSQEEQMYYANLLRLHEEGWTRDGRQRLLSWINKGRFHLSGSADFDAGGYFHYQGGRSFRPYVEVIRKRVLERMSDEDKADPALLALIDAKGPPPLSPDEELLSMQGQPVAWQVNDLLPALSRVGQGRSFERGRAAYFAVRCAECHSHGNHVADLSLGPDLTQSAGRFSARDLLESIIEPSKEISDQYADRVVWTHSGMMHTGTILVDDEQRLVIKPDPKADATVDIPRADVDEVHLARKSKMPADLLNPLTEDEILDLIAFVLSGGDENDGAFTSGE